jgi:hypothetical protein
VRSCREPAYSAQPGYSTGEFLITLAMRKPPGSSSPGDPGPQFLLRCKAIVNSLPIPHPFDADAFRAALEIRRNRRLILTAATLPSGCTGLWAASQSADYIFYGQRATPPEQLRVISHEIGHMTLGHRGTQVPASEFARLLFPHLDPHKVAAALALVPIVARYSETEETEAETFASVFLERIRTSH